MAVQSRADASWQGDLIGGSGSVRMASGSGGELGLTWRARAESRESGTSPEELIAAAHSGCFAMALANGLAQAGTPAERLETSAGVDFQAGAGGADITGIRLTVRGTVPGMDEATFKAAAEAAKSGCPVSKALSAVPITLEASLA
ncbi:MAG: OsmC family peroxiredoxin [Candidatus Dormibacteraeota bacterium]|nr:OsmC family peroxiredoxin [Candidatus Dormibacteraeota bacterium]